ncbi:hypothetical protein Cgig2_033206 [Carnegiea gigantea]|uniref:Uncharacterized protein n=1 Tax=Carnegiea gigantea TaxID=171969 RepID=A0A9Q1K1K8_9CARY|nr:hypothetical protein Cgig2_033206 [Carnegiea gigantea]
MKLAQKDYELLADYVGRFIHEGLFVKDFNPDMALPSFTNGVRDRCLCENFIIKLHASLGHALKMAKRGHHEGNKSSQGGTERDEKRSIKQNHKEKKENAFKIEPLFNVYKSGILIEIECQIPMDGPKTIKQRLKNKNKDKWYAFCKGYRHDTKYY